MPERVRFAPSPTGPLHIGGVRTALFNFLYAKNNKGQFILRIEDTDQNRYVPASEEYIYKALNWMGLTIDEGPVEGGNFGPYRQSERKAIYAKHIKDLLDSGAAYYAFDSQDALQKERENAEKAGRVFQYDQHSRGRMSNSLNCSEKETAAHLKSGNYVIRLKIDAHEPFVVKDLLRGVITVDPSLLDDKILMKSDGMPTYHFANVVDDHLMEITTVIRGEEWLPSLPLHNLIYQAFGWSPPEFIHLPLILKPEGKGKLSKRDGITGGFPVFPMQWEELDGFKERGVLPDALRNYLLLLGWNSGGEQEIFSFDQMINSFGIEGLQKGGARFDFSKAVWMNEQYLQKMSHTEFRAAVNESLDVLEEIYDAKTIDQILNMIQPRVKLLSDVDKEIALFHTDPNSYDAKTLDKLRPKLPKEFLPWCMDQIKNGQIDDLKSAISEWGEKNNCNMGVLMQALRLALVGSLSGPDLIDIMNVLKKDVTLVRIDHFRISTNL